MRVALFSFLAYLSTVTADVICVTDFDASASVDFYSSKVAIENNIPAKIEYFPNYKVITLGGSTICVYKCGTLMPSTMPNDASGNAIVCDVTYSPQTQNVAITSSDQIALMASLGALDKIKLALYPGSSISNQCLLDKITAGTVQNTDVNGDAYSWSSTTMSNTTFMDSDIEVTFSNGPFDDEAALKNPVDVALYLKPTLLGRVEWLKVVGALLDMEFLANQVYNDHVSRMNCLSNNVDLIKAAYPGTFGDTTVLWARRSDYVAYDGTSHEGWDVATCVEDEDTMTGFGPYYCDAAKKLDINLLNSTAGSVVAGTSVYMTNTEFEAYGKDADTWIIDSATNITTLVNRFPFIANFKSYINGNIYDNQKRGGNGWFEDFPLSPSAFLEDMATMAYPGAAILDGDKGFDALIWFRSVFTEEIGDWGTCDNDAYHLLDDRCITITEVNTLDGSGAGAKLGAFAMTLAAAAAGIAAY